MRKRSLAVAGIFLVLSALCIAGLAGAAERRLPRVLLIGDSICGYYKPYVVQFLKGRAEVVHGGHAADTRFGLAHIDRWLAKHKADVIHFNWGLHDLKKKGTQVPVEDYEKNLRELVRRMKATNAKLVFATTTPVGPRAARRNSDVIRYNAAALKVMKAEDVAVNDLYAVAFPIREKIQHTDHVHFKPYKGHPEPENDQENGSKILAKAVARSILKVLKGKESAPHVPPRETGSDV